MVEALRRRTSPFRLNPDLYRDDWTCVPVGTDGDVPQGRPAERLEALLRWVEDDFTAVSPQLKGEGSRLHRQLYLIMAWCHAAAPGAVRAYFLRVLRGGKATGQNYVIEAMGRVLSAPSELELFFTVAAEAAKQDRVPQYWIKAPMQVLQYRPHAPEAMTKAQALNLADAAGRVLVEEMDRLKIQPARLARAQRFRWALYLILAVLRFRLRDRQFLSAGDRDSVAVLVSPKSALARASEPLGKGDKGLPATVVETVRFLERRGTKGLILQETEAIDDKDDE